MSIQEIVTNIKRFLMNGDTFLAILLVLVAVASFGLGRMSIDQEILQKRTQNQVELITGAGMEKSVVPFQEPAFLEKNPSENKLESEPQTPSVGEEKYVASKNGTKYHLPWCAGAQQIKEENKIWFSSKEEAEKAGYSAASNCKGI